MTNYSSQSCRLLSNRNESRFGVSRARTPWSIATFPLAVPTQTSLERVVESDLGPSVTERVPGVWDRTLAPGTTTLVPDLWGGTVGGTGLRGPETNTTQETNLGEG